MGDLIRNEQAVKDYLARLSISVVVVQELGITTAELVAAKFRYLPCLGTWVR
jgi:hypothetical protein